MEIISSYSKNNFDLIIQTLLFMVNPKRIVEFGILEGYSLYYFLKYRNFNCKVDAYDIFDDFNGNHANYHKIISKFTNYDNLLIDKLNFYEGYKKYKDNSIDVLHIDIANDGDIYEYAIKNYLNKISKNGIIILEGGSVERDNVEWMIKYNKKKINPYLVELKKTMNITILEKFPSMTIIKK